MTKKDIDQSYTSWLIYSDYLEENGQLDLAEQIRFELDYKPFNYHFITRRGANFAGSVGCHDYYISDIGDYVGSSFEAVGCKRFWTAGGRL